MVEDVRRLAATPGRAVRREADAAVVSPRRSLVRGKSGLAAIGIALSAFAVLFAVVRAGRTATLDERVTLALQTQKGPWFARLMHAVSWAGFPPQSRLLPWAIPATMWGLGFRIEAVFQFLGWGTGFVSFLVKRIVRRPRPTHGVIAVAAARIGGSSFPSGHVINYIGVYGFLAYLLHTHLRPAALRRTLVGILAAVIALVGPSRIYLGHHWLTDVTASYLLGFSYLIGLTAVYRRVKAWLVEA